MALEDQFSQHDGQVVDKFHAPNASYQMTTRDYVMRPSVVAAAIIITLPPVAEAKGRFYSIFARAATMSLPITITSKGDDEGWEGDIVLYAAEQGCLLFSDGMKWCLRTFADIETAASPRGEYTQAASEARSGEVVAGRFRGEGRTLLTGGTLAAYGVHAQGIAYGDLFVSVVNALYAEAIAKDGSSTESTLRGAMITANSEGTPTLIANMCGAHIRTYTNVQPAGWYRGLLIEHEQYGGIHALLDEYIKIIDSTFHAGDVCATYGLRMLTTGTITNGISIESPVVNGINVVGTAALTSLGMYMSGEFDLAGISIGLTGTRISAQAGAPMIAVWCDSALATGTYDCVKIDFEQTAAIQTGYVKALRVHAVSDVKTPGSFNAIYAKLDYQTDGYPWGDCAPLSAELVLPNNAAIPRGLFAVLEAQINGGALSAFGGGGPLCFLHFNAVGTTTLIDSDAYLFVLDGVASGAANLWYDNQGGAPANVEEWIKVRTPAGDRWLALYNAVV